MVRKNWPSRLFVPILESLSDHAIVFIFVVLILIVALPFMLGTQAGNQLVGKKSELESKKQNQKWYIPLIIVFTCMAALINTIFIYYILTGKTLPLFYNKHGISYANGRYFASAIVTVQDPVLHASF